MVISRLTTEYYLLSPRLSEWAALSDCYKLMHLTLVCITTLLLFSCSIWFFATPWTAAGSPVLHSFPELAQTHVHWVSDAIQPVSFSVASYQLLNFRQFNSSVPQFPYLYSENNNRTFFMRFVVKVKPHRKLQPHNKHCLVCALSGY